ncbi:MAG: RsmD family RNA methyltransferase [Deltaproteobacteria bacterium]|jgi:16S rRNA (guanine966-N2)-methyltransferase|nr:RsmD family RNA methyltransferase [Deltaproteobacteria bacterium]
MPKIITGLFKGLNLLSPKDPSTRPTAALVRGAIFSILGAKPRDASVLDLFSGTGAMGLEALSRGAERLLMCDQSPAALGTIAANVKKIPPRLQPKAKTLMATFPRDFGLLLADAPYSLFLLDPPYDDPVDTVLSFLRFAADNRLAAPPATLVWEQSPKSLKLWQPQDLRPWDLLLARRWGKKAAAILELNA